jgi:hypothetical protein
MVVMVQHEGVIMACLHEYQRSTIRLVKRRVEDDFLSRPGVTAVDVGEKTRRGRPTGEAAIVVSVRHKDPRPESAIPALVDGVPTDVVEETIVLHRALLSPEGNSTPVLGAERHTTVVGGIGVGPGRTVRLVPPDVPVAGDYVVVGTLGALLVPRGAPGQIMGLTSFHVACVDDAWAVGDPAVHPSRLDGGRPCSDTVAVLSRAALSRGVAAAALSLLPGRAHRAEVVGVGPVRGAADPVVGARVRKRGRTTALTSGVVVSTDASVLVDFGEGLGMRVLRDQVRVASAERFTDFGDSGAVLVDDAGHVVGLHVAGSTTGLAGFANPIAPVLCALDADLLVGGAGPGP